MVQAWLSCSAMLSRSNLLFLLPNLSSRHLSPQGLRWLPTSRRHISFQRGRKRMGQTPELQSLYIFLMDTSSVLP